MTRTKVDFSKASDEDLARELVARLGKEYGERVERGDLATHVSSTRDAVVNHYRLADSSVEETSPEEE